MIARRPVLTQQQMEDFKIPLASRDECAHVLVKLSECRTATFYLPWKCVEKRNAYLRCEEKEYAFFWVETNFDRFLASNPLITSVFFRFHKLTPSFSSLSYPSVLHYPPSNAKKTILNVCAASFEEFRLARQRRRPLQSLTRTTPLPPSTFKYFCPSKGPCKAEFPKTSFFSKQNASIITKKGSSKIELSSLQASIISPYKIFRNVLLSLIPAASWTHVQMKYSTRKLNSELIFQPFSSGDITIQGSKKRF